MKNSHDLAFSHIPKTAGTSLRFLLLRYFGSTELDAIARSGSKAIYLPENLRRDMRVYPRVKLLAGHSVKPFVNFGNAEANLKWFTFLRDPAKRYISHYVHQQTGDPLYNMGLHSWAKRFNRKDWMVRMLAGEENLEKAKEILHERFEFIGKTEDFDLSMKMFKVKFEMRGFDTRLGENKMVVRDAGIKDEIYGNYEKYEELILNENRLDSELYKYFIQHIWPVQKEEFQSQKEWLTEDELKSNWQHLFNLHSAKLKRNLIYKPSVKLFG